MSHIFSHCPMLKKNNGKVPSFYPIWFGINFYKPPFIGDFPTICPTYFHTCSPIFPICSHVPTSLPIFFTKNGNVPSFYISSLHLFLSIYFPYDLGVDPLPMTPTFRASPIHRSGCGSCMSKSSITARRPVVLHPWKINGQSMDNQLPSGKLT